MGLKIIDSVSYKVSILPKTTKQLSLAEKKQNSQSNFDMEGEELQIFQ